MISASNEVIEAAGKLTGDSRFEVLKLWIQKSKKASAEALETANNDTLVRQLQGECQALGKIIDTIEFAAANR